MSDTSTEYRVQNPELMFPENYLKCSKVVDGKTVVTGWAPNVEAAGKHAVAVGGEVLVHDKSGKEVASFSDPAPCAERFD